MWKSIVTTSLSLGQSFSRRLDRRQKAQIRRNIGFVFQAHSLVRRQSVLTNVIHGLNRGVDPGGSSIGAPTEFVVGVAANHGALDQEREVRRFAYKVEAGADYAVTQPVFDAESLERFLERVHEWRVPVVAGIWPDAEDNEANVKWVKDYYVSPNTPARGPDCGGLQITKAPPCGTRNGTGSRSARPSRA